MINAVAQMAIPANTGSHTRRCPWTRTPERDSTTPRNADTKSNPGSRASRAWKNGNTATATGVTRQCTAHAVGRIAQIFERRPPAARVVGPTAAGSADARVCVVELASMTDDNPPVQSRSSSPTLSLERESTIRVVGTISTRIRTAWMRRLSEHALWLPASLMAATALVAVPLQGQSNATDRLPRADAYAWGSERARLQVVEYIDLGCGACRRFHEETYAHLFSEYVETGAVHWTVVPFESGAFRGSGEAARVAVCAAPDATRFLEVLNLVLGAQREWSRAANPRTTVLDVLAEAGFDAPSVRRCLATDASDAVLNEGNRRAAAAAVRATPTFVVGEFVLPGALPLDFFRQYLDLRLAEVGPG